MNIDITVLALSLLFAIAVVGFLAYVTLPLTDKLFARIDSAPRRRAIKREKAATAAKTNRMWNMLEKY